MNIRNVQKSSDKWNGNIVAIWMFKFVSYILLKSVVTVVLHWKDIERRLEKELKQLTFLLLQHSKDMRDFI